MKSLFDAIRASSASAIRGMDAFAAFTDFERANRGHRQLLDELALDLATRPARASDATASVQYLACRRRFSESFDALLFALQFTPEEAFAHNDWRFLLDAPDDSGLLAKCTLGQLSSWATWDANRSAPLGIRLCDIRLKRDGDTLDIALTLTGPAKLRAERSLRIDSAPCTTLREARALGARFRQALQALLSQAPDFAEFSAQRQHETTRRELTGRLKTLLASNFSRDELQWLREHAGTFPF